MVLSDSQLMLLEQLTYLNNSVYKGAGTSKVDNPKTVAELMSAFMDENGNLDLSELESPDTSYNGEFTSAKQWAGMLRAIAEDESLMRLEIGDSYKDADGVVLATCYADPYSDEAYVTFKGTTGAREWHDNVLGLYQSDTACQQEALAFIESLPFDNITVTGHSKGGNKAMYVTLLSDKVKRCVAMDGQGFSKEFYEKYWAEVQKKGHLISNYSLDDDYVHILLSPVPNSNQVYCHGYNKGGADNHSPSSYFEFKDDENGNSNVVVQDNGTVVTPTTENEGLTYLHEFTNFIVNVMPYEKREYMAKYLGVILAGAMVLFKDKKDSVEINGTIYTKKTLIEFILADKDALATLFAYIIKYVETYDLTMDELRALLEGFGMGKVADSLNEIVGYLQGPPMNFDVEEAFNWLISQIGKNLSDGKDDEFLLWLLETFLGNALKDYGVTKDDINEIWSKIEDAYTDIGQVDPNTANNNLTTKIGKIRDFSIRNYEILMDAINKFAQSKIDGVQGWNSYKSERWFSRLNVSIAIRLINAYAEYISDLNVESGERIRKVFSDVESVDNRNVKAMELHTSYLTEEIQQLKQISMRINPHLIVREGRFDK